ncbi:MAG: tetratricopeptide repeat protein [Bacteroidales bacterium]|nr:tetratricopeptide repeat protein [Bacteroidales bacterium]
MKKIITLISFWGIIFTALQSPLSAAVPTKHDSIKLLIENANPSEMASLYNSLANLYLPSNPMHSIAYTDTAIKLASLQGQELELANSYQIKGLAYKEIQQYDSASKLLHKAEQIFRSKEKTNDLSEILETLLSLYLELNEFNRSIEINFQTLDLELALNDSAGIAQAYYNIASTYHSWEKLDSAMLYYNKALKLAGSGTNKRQLGNIHNRLGNIYFSWGNYDQALEYYLKSLHIFEEINDSAGLSKSYNNIGVINHDWKNYQESLKYYNLSYIVDSLLHNVTGQSQTLNNIAILNEDMGDRERSMRTYFRSLKLAEQAEEHYQIAVTNSNIGGLYLEDGYFEQAEAYFNKAVEHYKKANSVIGLAETDILFGDLYFEQGDYAQAEEYYKWGLDFALSNKLSLSSMNAYNGLALASEKRGNFKAALEYTNKYHAISDSIFDINTSRQLALLSNAYEIQKKDQEMEIQELRLSEQHSKINKQQIAVISLSAVILLIIIYTLIIIRQYNLRIRAWRQLLVQHNQILKSRQELILAKNKAEESDKLKSAFLVNLSHELRTPMNGIMGFTDLLQRDNATEEQRKIYISYIASSSRQLLRVLNDIIDISAIETNQLELTNESCNLDEIMTGLLHTFEQEKKDREKDHIEIIYEAPGENDKINIIADKRRLSQIIFNLLSNALTFTREGRISFGYKVTDNAMIRIFVKDTGIGIERSKFEMIFDRFRQVDDSTTRQHGGSGLGLAISRELLQMMNGTIYLESEVGKGTTFYAEIPIRKE